MSQFDYQEQAVLGHTIGKQEEGVCGLHLGQPEEQDIHSGQLELKNAGTYSNHATR